MLRFEKSISSLTAQKDRSGAQMGERMIFMSTTLNLASVKPSLDKLQAIERELAASLIERDEVIRQMRSPRSPRVLRSSVCCRARSHYWPIRISKTSSISDLPSAV